MKSITIHGINDDLSQKILEKSKEFGLSQNRTVKTILENILLSKQKTNRRKMFSDLFGKWSIDEKIEFEKRISELQKGCLEYQPIRFPSGRVGRMNLFGRIREVGRE